MKIVGYYWAKFEGKNGNLFRFDTRVYLNDIDFPTNEDLCIGAVVGKNPGRALPSNLSSNVLQEVVLDNDQLLPTIRSIFSKAHKLSNKTIVKSSYIQVLNLMYVCDEILSRAIQKNVQYQTAITCDTEKKEFPFLWYVWGGDNTKINPYKSRFANLKTNQHFYLDHKKNIVVNNSPGLSDHARHTQGMQHGLIIPYISKLL